MPSSRITSATAEMSASVLRALRRVSTDISVRSGTMPEKILTCLTCPAITAADTPARFQNLDALAELPERDPVEVRAGVARRRLELGERLFLDGDDGDVVAEARWRPAARETETGRCRRSDRSCSYRGPDSRPKRQSDQNGPPLAGLEVPRASCVPSTALTPVAPVSWRGRLYRSSVAFLSRAAWSPWPSSAAPATTALTPRRSRPPCPMTETFTGTVTLNGAINHCFSVSTAGTITPRLPRSTPSAHSSAFSSGTWNGVACSAVSSNDAGTLQSVAERHRPSRRRAFASGCTTRTAP